MTFKLSRTIKNMLDHFIDKIEERRRKGKYDCTMRTYIPEWQVGRDAQNHLDLTKGAQELRIEDVKKFLNKGGN